MVIQNLERSYVVIQSCPGEGRQRQYLCREDGDGQWREKKIGRIPLAEVSGGLIRFLMDQIHRESFRDFEDYFTDDEFLCVVMGLGEGKPLAVKLQEEKCTLRERLEMGKNLIERLVLLNPDPYFFRGAMAAERIRVSAALETAFDYDISDITEHERADFAQGAEGLSGVMEVLFLQERKQRSMPELDRFCYGLSHGEWGDYLSIHREYLKVFERWADKEEKDLQPKTWGFRLWEMVKASLRGLKKLALLGILVLAAAYLALSVRDFVQPPAVRENYKRIGTLQIETESETAESAEGSMESESAGTEGSEEPGL